MFNNTMASMASMDKALASMGWLIHAAGSSMVQHGFDGYTMGMVYYVIHSHSGRCIRSPDSFTQLLPP
jgi:hypothetical protein